MDDYKKRVFMIIVLIFGTILLFLAGVSIYRKTNYVLRSENANSREYKYHYMLVGKDADGVFWQGIYDGAAATGKEKDILVENLGTSVEKTYSVKDLMEIAIDAAADGIIVEADGSDEVEELINRASDINIPVVTVQQDAPNSKRKSFVGANNYQMGEMYGNQILNLDRGESLNATVILSEGQEDSATNLFYSAISNTLRDSNVVLTPMRIEREEEFSAEEAIRNLIIKKSKNDNELDVLVCLNAADTICAYQAVIDYNLVGMIEVIGYYSSEEILQAIQKGIVRCSVSADAQEMGKRAVEVLSESQKNRYVSEYTAVGAKLITDENVREYLEKIEEKKK